MYEIHPLSAMHEHIALELVELILCQRQGIRLCISICAQLIMELLACHHG